MAKNARKTNQKQKLKIAAKFPQGARRLHDDTDVLCQVLAA